ncbi:hypothetical protein NMG60_11004542 [Bertholletia excelsa]
MSCTTKPVFKSLSTANGCLISLPSIFRTKSLSTPSKPINLRLSCSQSSLVSSCNLRERSHSSTLVAFVAQTSDWAQQEEDNTIVVEDNTIVVEDSTIVVEDKEEEQFTWKNQEIDSGDAGESSEQEVVFEGEESYPEPPEEAKLFVGNLPYDIDSEKLAQLFDPAGVVEIAEVIYNRETDRSRGFGFVTMSTVEEAEKAVEMFHRYDLNGRLLTVNKAAPRGSQPERPPRVFEPTYKIYVGNLPWDVDNGRLEQVFSEHGKVVDARVVYDRETGRSRGFGFVTMSTEAELNDAIENLDGQNLGGRTIRVNVAEERPRRFF